MEHLIIWHSNFWLGFIFEWKTLLLCFVLENIQNQKGLALGVMFSYFTIFHIHTFRSFQKFNAYFELFLKQKFQDPSIKSFRDEKSYFRSKSKDKLKIHAHFQQQIGYFSLFLSRNSEYSHHVRTKHLVQFDEPTLLSPKY